MLNVSGHLAACGDEHDPLPRPHRVVDLLVDVVKRILGRSSTAKP
jgi:hypothetical protein